MCLGRRAGDPGESTLTAELRVCRGHAQWSYVRLLVCRDRAVPAVVIQRQQHFTERGMADASLSSGRSAKTALRRSNPQVRWRLWVDTANLCDGKAVGGVLPSESPEACDCTAW